MHFELFSSYTCADIVFLCMATSIVQENNATGKVVMSLFGLNVTDAGSLMRCASTAHISFPLILSFLLPLSPLSSSMAGLQGALIK